jgi:hypothetical protein
VGSVQHVFIFNFLLSLTALIFAVAVNLDKDDWTVSLTANTKSYYIKQKSMTFMLTVECQNSHKNDHKLLIILTHYHHVNEAADIRSNLII